MAAISRLPPLENKPECPRFLFLCGKFSAKLRFSLSEISEARAISRECPRFRVLCGNFSAKSWFRALRNFEKGDGRITGGREGGKLPRFFQVRSFVPRLRRGTESRVPRLRRGRKVAFRAFGADAKPRLVAFGAEQKLRSAPSARSESRVPHLA